MKVVVVAPAQKEFQQAKEFYEMAQSGLGERFNRHIKKALLRIKASPLTWPIEKKEIRRYLVHKFPYKILYAVHENTVVVLAFAHQHREPGYWQDR